jgi:hypothetical protein
MIFNKINCLWYAHGDKYYSSKPDIYPEYEVDEVALQQIKDKAFKKNENLNLAVGKDIIGPLHFKNYKYEIGVHMKTVDGINWFEQQIRPVAKKQ